MAEWRDFVLVLAAVLGLLAAGTSLGQESQQNSSPEAPQGVPQVAHPARVRVSQGVAQGLLVKKVNPRYPLGARQEHVQGTVVLMVLISREGDVSEVKLISGDPMLAPAAIDAVKKWKYKPYLLDGQPVEAGTTVQINFTLSGG